MFRFALLLLLAGGMPAVAEEWRAQITELLEYDARPQAWKTLIPTGDPGERVPPDARQRWLDEEQSWPNRRKTPEVPGPVDEEYARDDLGVPYPYEVRKHPAHWIPEVVKFIGDPQRHDLAVTCLIQFHLDDAREDALKPLLPWLLDPAWSSAPDRLRLIQSLDRIVLPEAEAGLLRVLTTEDDSERAAAAGALAALHSTAAVEALRRLTTDGTDLGHHARNILYARVRCGGFTMAECLTAFEALAATAPDDAPGHVRETVGVILDSPTLATAALAEAVLARSAVLHTTDAISARRLRESVQHLRFPAVLDAVLDDLAAGRLAIPVLLDHLGNPAALRDQRRQRLERIADQGGHAGGVAIMLAGDTTRRDLAVSGNDVAQIATICTTGLLSGEQPPGTIAALIDHADALVSRAAQRWVMETTDPAVRRAIFARRSDTLILGRLPGWDPGHHTRDGFLEQEDDLRARLRQPEAPVRIFALLSGSYWGETPQYIIEEHATQVRFIELSDRDRRRVRNLTADEYTAFRQALTSVASDRLPAAELSVHDGTQYEHVELDRSGGFRVWMNNPDVRPASPWDILVHAWFALKHANTPEVQWPILDTIPGARVLHDGGRVGLACDGVDGSDGVRLYCKKFHPRDEIEGSGWYRLDDGQRVPCSPPVEWPVIHERPEWLYANSSRFRWQALVGDGEVFGGGSYSDDDHPHGLWWLRSDGPNLILLGKYGHALALPDTTTVLVEHAPGDYWSEDPVFQVIDYTTGNATTCDGIPAGSWWALAHVPGRGVLLEGVEPDQRATSDDPAIAAESAAALALGGGMQPDQRRRLCWLDPVSGRCTPTQGEPAPLRDQHRRPLQAVTDRPGLVWAMLPARGGTRVGHYDPATLAFTEVARVDGLEFDSQDCWVDAAGGRLLIARRGDLLLVPLAGLAPAAKP